MTGIQHLLQALVAAGLALAGAAYSTASAEEAPRVTITGGVDLIGHNYRWEVTNHHASPIVYIEFPHYQADLFTSPVGWTSESTYLVNVGVPDRPGTCAASPESPLYAIHPGGTAEFGMRISARGAPSGPGNVKIRFADDKEIFVTGVELPQVPNVGFEHYPLVTIGIIFVGWVVWRETRRRKAPLPQSDRAGGDDP